MDNTDSRWTRPDPPPTAQTRSSFVKLLVAFVLFPSSVFTLTLWFTTNRDIQQQRLMISTKSRTEDGHNFPRVVYLEGNISFGPQRLGIHRKGQQHEFELPDLIREVGIPGHYATPPEGECKSVHRWHLTQHPTCNSMHEMDLFFGLQKMGHRREHRTPKAKLFNSGGTRDAWKFSITEFDDDTGSNLDRLFAFRTLRLLKEYWWTRVENQRVDAIVNERLSSSQNVIDIYGFCGTGTVNEFADSGTLYNYLESFDSTYLDRLSLARDIAHGIADIHEVDGNPAGLVQHDVKLANVLVSGGRAKIADFNNCHFAQQRDDGSQCYFNFAQACERLKSHITPVAQECQQQDGGKHATEKIEVFQLGLILLYLLTLDRSVYEIQLNNPPDFPSNIVASTDLSVSVLRYATEKALTVDAVKRPSARSVANFLARSIISITSESP